MNRDAKGSTTSGDGEMEMVWIFTSGNFAEVEIITDIFEEEDIAYRVQKMEPPGFYVNVGGLDQIRVAVDEKQAKQARTLIQQAIVDEAVPGDGNFMEADESKAEKKAKKKAEKAQKKAKKSKKE